MSYTDPAINQRASLRRGIAVLLAFLLAIGTVVATAPATRAATPGIISTVLLNGDSYNGTDVLTEGDEVILRVQYNTDVAPGSTVVFELGDNITLSGVPTANTAIGSVTASGNQVSITFLDPWPPGVNQGVFDLRFTVNEVSSSVQEEITWTINGDEHSIDIIIRDEDDEFADVSEGYDKGAAPGNLDSYVSVVDGVVTLDPALLDQELSYTLQIDSPEARSDFEITDQLPAGLDYVADSFEAHLTTWDAAGLNRTTDPFAFAPVITGNSFSAVVDVVPAPSVLSIAYKAKVTDLTVLQALLQAEHDGLSDGYGQFQIFLTNTATFGDASTSREGSIRLRHTVANPNPGPNIGNAFGKTSDWSSRNVEADEDGMLTPPAEIVYTLSADLRQWDEANPNRILDRNVVISDILPAQARWDSAAADFLTADGIVLAPVATCPATVAEFAHDDYVNQYCVDGQRLLINVGQDNTTNASIQVKALLDTVAGLVEAGSTTIQDATPHRLRNDAYFHYRSGDPYQGRRDVTVVVLPDAEGGLNDSSVFTKSGTAEDDTVAPGESVTVNYTFDIAAGKGIDARTVRIVDHVDTEVFDLSDLGTVGISGSYDGQALSASDFELSIDAEGNLVIELSDTGKAVVDVRGVDRRYLVSLSLTTRPFEGKETRTITNRATLFGVDDEPLYWSSTGMDATSYGDEAEVRKRLYDSAADAWTDVLGAAMDGSGQLVQDIYVYRIQFIPHGSYDDVVISPVYDLLPGAVEFLGFVDESDVAAVSSPMAGPIDIGGNLVAAYDAAAGIVSIEQQPGTRLQAGAPIAAYFAVRVVDSSAPIVNAIGDTSATIVPLPSVSVGDYVWLDTDRDGRQGDIASEPGIPGVWLELVGPDGGPVTDVFGNPVLPVETGPDGEYTFENLPVLTGSQTYTVRIDREASAEALRRYVPTRAGAGDRVFDSSTGEASTVPGDLQEDGQRDPTLDFGFVLEEGEVLSTTGADSEGSIAAALSLLGLGGALLLIGRRRGARALPRHRAG